MSSNNSSITIIESNFKSNKVSLIRRKKTASVQLQPNNNTMPNTKIHICPVDDSWDSTIRQYFSQLGQVKSISYPSKDDFGYGFVQSENAESATIAIAKCKHNIGGKTVIARAADIQTEFKMPAADFPCNILNKLNEHCLMEIFEYLSVLDLCSVGNVCRNFQTVAKKVFSVKALVIKTVDLRNWSLFRLSGPEIETIEIHFGFNDVVVDNRILDLLATYCSEPVSALNKITILNWEINGEFMERLRAIFSRIQVLCVVYAPTNGTVAKLLSNCNELMDLQLTYIDFGGIHKIIFPKLESLKIEQILGPNDFMMNRFLKSNPQLEMFTTDIPWPSKLTSRASRNLGVNISELCLLGDIKISREYVDSMLDFLKRLKNLKSLGFNCSPLSADRVLDVLIEQKLPIEELHLTNFQIDSSFVKAIKSLEHLKKTHFSVGDWDDENLFVEIVKAHPQLQSFILYCFGDVTVVLIIEMVKFSPTLEYIKSKASDYGSINSDEFTSILRSVKNRPIKIKLKIELCCHGIHQNIPERMKMESREWLEIEIEGNGPSIEHDTDAVERWRDENDSESDENYHGTVATYTKGYDSDNKYYHDQHYNSQ